MYFGRKTEHEIECIVPIHPATKDKKWPKLDRYNKDVTIKRADDTLIDYLRTFDLLLLAQMWDPLNKDQEWWYMPFLKAAKPFVIWIHNELEVKRFFPKFVNQSECQAVLINSWKMSDFIKKHIDPTMPFYECKPIVLEDATHLVANKEMLVASFSRVTNVKRLPELAKLAPDMRKAGFTVRIHGQQHNHWEVRTIKSVSPDIEMVDGIDWGDKFEVMDKIMYFWNPSYRKVPVPWNPHLECAVAEAISRGCVPILHKQAIPDGMIVGNDCLAFDPVTPTSIVTDLLAHIDDRPRIVKNAWKYMNERYEGTEQLRKVFEFLEGVCV